MGTHFVNELESLRNELIEVGKTATQLHRGSA